MIKRVFIIINFLIYLMSGFASAENSFTALFEKANAHYAAGDFKSAADLYSAIESQGCINDKVLYDLGNCYLKLGDIGRAIAYYRRAQKLSPRDPDIRANLELARSLVNQPVKPLPSNFLGKIINFFRFSTKTSELTVFSAFIYLLTVAFFTVGRLTQRRRLRRRFFRLFLGALVVLILAAVTLGVRIYDSQVRETAVAVGKITIARNGPGEHFTEVFKQQPGYEVTIKRHESGWVEVALANGYMGWVPENSLQKI